MSKTTCPKCGGRKKHEAATCWTCAYDREATNALYEARRRGDVKCAECGTRKTKTPTNPRCPVCIAGGPAAYADRQRARKHRYGTHRPMEVLRAEWAAKAAAKQAALEAARAIRPRPWREREDVRALVQAGLTEAAAISRVRFRIDSAFAEKQRERMKVRRHVVGRYDHEARTYAAYATGDGTLTRLVLRAMFAWQRECPYCGKAMGAREKSLDHVTPLSRGGTHTADNVVVCCRSCNSRKHARTPEEWQASA